MIYAKEGYTLPQAFSFRTEEIWQRILGRITSSGDGDLVMTQGQDWVSKDYSHLNYLAFLATRFQRADASVYESRGQELIRERQLTHTNGSRLDQPRIGYETMLIMRMAYAWQAHEQFGPSPAPTANEFDVATESTSGVQAYEYTDFIQGRLGNAFVSMSWDEVRPMGLMAPKGERFPDDPIFTYYLPRSLIGSARGKPGDYSCDCRENYFSTAGTIGERRFSMTAFRDGTTLLLDRGEGSTFNFAVEDIPGVTGPRPTYSEAGEGLGSLPGNWVNAADRLGMVALGGGGLSAKEGGGASENKYRLVEGSKSTGSGNRGAALFPLIDHQATANLAGYAEQISTPDDWAALSARAPDASRRIAVARWGGPPEAKLELTDDRGGPVTEQPATISGSGSRATARMDAPGSIGQTIRFFVQSEDDVEARQDGEHRAILTNPHTQPVPITTSYVGEDGTIQTVTRILAPGEQVTARLVDSELTLAGREYEHLLAAKETFLDLETKVEAWRAANQITQPQFSRLSGIVTKIGENIESALEEARAEDPDTAHASAEVDEALRHLGALSSEIQDGYSDDVRTGLERATESMRNELTSAQKEAYPVKVRLQATNTARPGEPLRMRATISNRGQGDATHGRLVLNAPDGWRVEPSYTAFKSLSEGGATTVEFTPTVSSNAKVGSVASLAANLEYRRKGSTWTVSSSPLEVPIKPLVSVEAITPRLPLAAGGWNRATLKVANHAERALEVRVVPSAPDGVSTDPASQTLELPASGTEEVGFELRNDSNVNGTGRLDVEVMHGETGSRQTIDLLFSNNLALNPVDSQWPAVFSDSKQPNYPPALAVDGSTGTFWVSGGAAAGEGPTPAKPIALGVDFGAPVTVGSVTMRPRTNYGPKAYTIEVSQNGETWREVAAVPSAPNGITVTTFSPTEARYLRLKITDSHDPVRPPRNVQVAELEVRAK